MEKNITPKIRFPEFKEGWRYTKLSELLSESKKRNMELEFDKSHVLSVSGELGVVNQIEHLGRSYAGASVQNYHVLETGNLVYTKSPLKANPYGIIKLNKGKAGIVSTLYAVYEINYDKAVGEFLDYYFSLDANTNRYLRPLVKKGAKNDMKINNEYVLHDCIYVPKIDEQEKIASFFKIVEKKINQLTKKKLLLKEYKSGLIQKLFSLEIRFTKLNGDKYSEWKKIGFDEVYKFKSTNSFSKDMMNYDFGEIRNIHYGDLHTKYKSHFDVIKETVPFINVDIDISRISEDSFCRRGDLVIADASEDYSDIGKTIEIVNLHGERVVAGLHTILARPFTNRIRPGFGSYMMQSRAVRDQVRLIAQGSKVLGLSAKQLAKISIYLPEHDEQDRITGVLRSLDLKIEYLEYEISKLRSWKKGLLQQMFC